MNELMEAIVTITGYMGLALVVFFGTMVLLVSLVSSLWRWSIRRQEQKEKEG